MLSRSLRKNFSSQGPFGLGTMFKNIWKVPQRIMGVASEPTAKRNDIMGNTTAEAFDEVSSEWQALITENAFEVHTHAYYEEVTQNNFGTVDNPHVVFTSDAPFRYVGCTGQPNPDDYEGHEFMLFMLREGPLQRCPVCGQVYKLVRLRDESSAENDYYLASLMPYEHQEFGEADHWSHNSLHMTWGKKYEHTNFPVESDRVYSLVNPDDHDKILVDPAYRMEKLTEGEKVATIFNESLKEISKKIEEQHPQTTALIMEKETYETLIDAEIMMRRFDRQYKKLSKFHARQYLDLDNHERREQRMLAKANERQVDSYTVFYGGLSEEELMYMDYFETDIEDSGENEAYDRILDEEIVRSDPDYRAEKYDFAAHYTNTAVQDAQSVIQNIVFKFRNRRQIDSPQDYERRQARLVERQVERATHGEFGQKEARIANTLQTGNQQEKVFAEAEYLDLIFNDSLQQFADYYETDGQEDLEILTTSDRQDSSGAILAFKDYTKLNTDTRGYYSIPKRKWNNGLGLTGNLIEEFRDLTTYVLPRMEQMSNVAQAQMLTSRDEQYMIDQKATPEVESKTQEAIEEEEQQ